MRTVAFLCDFLATVPNAIAGGAVVVRDRTVRFLSSLVAKEVKLFMFNVYAATMTEIRPNCARASCVFQA